MSPITQNGRARLPAPTLARSLSLLRNPLKAPKIKTAKNVKKVKTPKTAKTVKTRKQKRRVPQKNQTGNSSCGYLPRRSCLKYRVGASVLWHQSCPQISIADCG